MEGREARENSHQVQACVCPQIAHARRKGEFIYHPGTCILIGVSSRDGVYSQVQRDSKCSIACDSTSPLPHDTDVESV